MDVDDWMGAWVVVNVTALKDDGLRCISESHCLGIYGGTTKGIGALAFTQCFWFTTW